MFPGKSQSQSNQATAAQGQPSMLAGQSSSSTASATTALQEDIDVKLLNTRIHAAVLNVRAQAMIVAGEPMTEESASELNKLVKACLALHDALAALGEHNASRVAVSSAFLLSGFTMSPPQHLLGPLAAAASCDLTDVTSSDVSHPVAPPLQRTTAALGGIVGADNELLAAAAAASGEVIAATGIEAIDIEGDVPVSPAPDSSSSSSSLAPGTHVAGPRQALAAAPTVQQAAPPAPPASASNNP